MELIITVFLKGKLKGPVLHTTKQSVTVDISKVGAKYPEYITRKILYTDRGEFEAYRKLLISEEVVKFWISNECPYWEKPYKWKSLKTNQRLQSYIDRFDEGFGVSFIILNN